MHSVPASLDERLPATAAAVGRARDAVAGFAAAVGADEAELDAVRLAVSEAVTNAVQHGYRGEPGEIRVTAKLDGRGVLRVSVRDDGYGMRHPAAHPGMGFGLGLIAEFTEEMAVVGHAQGTELRMRFTLRAAQASRLAGGPAPVDQADPARLGRRGRRAPGYRAAVAAS